VASPGPRRADTFPKCCIRNAQAVRQPAGDAAQGSGHLADLTWAQVLDEVRAYAAACTASG
jgi:hypothetical protein